MSLFLPFNFNSSQALEVTTGNFTIPAGKYAHLSAHCSGGATLIIDGTEAQKGGTTTTALGATRTTVGVTTVVVPATGYFVGSGFVAATAGTVTSSSVTVILRTSGSTEAVMHGNVYVAGGGNLSVAVSNAGSGLAASVSGYVIIEGANTTANYWLSEGTILTGTANKTVTLFDIT